MFNVKAVVDVVSSKLLFFVCLFVLRVVHLSIFTAI